MITLINYADRKFARQQKYNNLTAKLFGGLDLVISCSSTDIDPKFKQQNNHILNQKRGGGYWLWKPWIILNELNTMKDGDYLLYCDSGAVFLKSVKPLIREFEALNQSVLGFQIPLIEKQWTKKETFIILDANSEEFRNSPQICASYIFFKKDERALAFLKKYLYFCQNEKALSDKISDYDNDEDFIAHRHDQSIFSLLFKKYNYKALGDLSDYGFYPEAYCQPRNRLIPMSLKSPTYAGTILSVRGANPFIYTIKYFGKRILKNHLPDFYNKRFNPRNVQFNYPLP